MRDSLRIALSTCLFLALASGLACSDPVPEGQTPGDDAGVNTSQADDVESEDDVEEDAENGDNGNNGENSDTGSDDVDDGDPDTGEPPQTQAVDVLWMIDNSATMCGAQQILREGIVDFVEALDGADFHFAITTTHMEDNYPLEPLARPGHFQSTPQPLPGFDGACHYQRDADGNLDINDLTPVLDNIALAVGCTEDPSQLQHLLTPDEDELHCALNRYAPTCTVTNFPEIETFFPDPQDYRDLPTVLRSEDYRDGQGDLDLESLQADFACMSMVGSRGYGFEKGLGAVVAALSPELTGGYGADPESHPNAGFLREGARTAVVFITDENDCTHDGSLDETSNCAVGQCNIQENLGDDGALVAVSDLRRQFLMNIARSRDGIEWITDPTLAELESLLGDTVVAASIHGEYERDLEASPEDCGHEFYVEPSCDNEFGRAWSGHRYAEFISAFPAFYPDPRIDPTEAVDIGEIPGQICSDFGSTLADMGATFLYP